MLDLDDYKGNVEQILLLQPRALVRTSPGHYQAWLTLLEQLAAKSAVQVALELTQALGGDRASVNANQQGRRPGSLKAKNGKVGVVALLHSHFIHMDEAGFLSTIAAKKVAVCNGEAVVHQKRKSHGVDQSGQDWKMCMDYFESNPGASAASALEELAGLFKADRGENQAYYEKLTFEKAKQRARGREGGTKGGDGGRAVVIQQPVADPAQQLVIASEVNQMIAQAIQRKLPQPTRAGRLCAGCDQKKPRAGFVLSQSVALDAERKCLACQPIDECFRRRFLATRVCSFCRVEKACDNSSDAQLHKGTEAKCSNCVHDNKEGEKQHVQKCKACGADKVKAAFSDTQLAKSLQEDSKCNECAQRDLSASQYQASSQRQDDVCLARPSGEWHEGSKSEAQRWLLEAPLLSLPSVCRKSYQAMMILRGRKDWQTKVGAADESELIPVQKVHLTSSRLVTRICLT